MSVSCVGYFLESNWTDLSTKRKKIAWKQLKRDLLCGKDRISRSLRASRKLGSSELEVDIFLAKNAVSTIRWPCAKSQETIYFSELVRPSPELVVSRRPPRPRLLRREYIKSGVVNALNVSGWQETLGWRKLYNELKNKDSQADKPC